MVTQNTKQLLYEHMIDSIAMTRTVTELHNTTQHSKYTPEHVSCIFDVGIGMAKDILATSTQKGIQHAVMALNQ